MPPMSLVIDADPAARAALPVGLSAFAGYLAALAPAPYLLDSAELAAASFGLGVAHPPGEPVALLWGRLFSLLPLGSVAFRVGLGQAVAGAVAVALVYRLTVGLVRALDRRNVLGTVGRGLLGATAALGYGAGPGTVLSAARPEVYALGTALALAALGAALLAGLRLDPRPALLGALLIGLGLGNHPLVAGLAGAAAAVVALPLLGSRATSRGRLIGGSVAALGAGLAVLAYLPVRAHVLAGPGHALDVVWGDGRTLGGLGWIVTARTFVAKTALVHRAAEPGAFPFVVIEEVGMALALVALAGLFFGVRTPRARLATVGLALAALGASLAALRAGFDPHNPDIRGYLGVALAAVAILGSAGAVPLVIVARGRGVAVTASVALLVAVLFHHLGARRFTPVEARGADQVAAELLAELPPRAALATSHFETAFLVAYQRLVEGRRPDVAGVHLGFVRGPGYAARVLRDEPALAPLLNAHAQGAVGLDAARAVGRPLAFEPDDFLDARLRASLIPVGSTWLLPVGEGPPERPTPLGEELWAEAARDRQLRGFLAYRAYRDAALACERRLGNTSSLRLGELRVLVPGDPRAGELLRWCARASR